MLPLIGTAWEVCAKAKMAAAPAIVINVFFIIVLFDC
jgi:hypothetical protein